MWIDAQGFRDRIDRVLTADGIRGISRAVTPGHSEMPRNASLMNLPRMIVCLEGKVRFACKDGDLVGEVALNPHEGLFIGPGRWVLSRARERYVSLGVVFNAGTTRFYLMQADPARDVHPVAPVATHSVATGLGEDGRALARILAGTPPGVAADRFFRHTFECLLNLVRELLTYPESGSSGGKARFTWEAACDFVLDNLHQPLSRKDVSHHLGVHPNHLSRLFAEFGNETFAEFLQARRLERARLLMADPRLNIAQVAQLSGFGSANYFTRVFRARTGRTPTHGRRPDHNRDASPK